MPIPTPSAGESEQDFVSRCMADDVMMADYPDAEQRAAVCHRQMNTTALGAGNPHSAKVIERRDDGSALVEVPVAVVTEKIDFSKTAGGGSKDGKITDADLREMVANFPRWPQPVGVGFDGLEPDDTHASQSRGGPQEVFIDSVSFRDGALFAVMELNAFAASLVVGNRAYRGFSMEARRNPSLPTGSFSGWVLTGGLFTNRPATDTQFRIAASDTNVTEDERGRSFVAFQVTAPGPVKEDTTMSDTKDKAPTGAETTVSLTHHEQVVAKVKDELAAKTTEVASLSDQLRSAQESLEAVTSKQAETQSEILTLRDENATLGAKVNRIESELKAAREAKSQLTQALNESAEKLHTAEQENLSVRVRKTIEDAIEAKVPPAVFDGYEANPAEWMEARYASFDAFESSVTALRGVTASSAGSAFKSGHDPAKANDPDKVELTEEEQAILAKQGGTDFVGVTTEAEARRVMAARAKAKKE